MKELRRKRLIDLLNGPRFNGDRKALYQAAGISKGRLTQLLDPREKFGDVAADNLCESLKLPTGWFDSATAAISEHVQASSIQDATVTRGPINLTNNPDFPSVRRVRFKLSAGASGFAVDYVDDDMAPIVFQRQWFERHGYTPSELLATKVANGSMEPGLYHGDTVIINTGDTNIVDGEVFAMNYEGELVIKRMVRDASQWWLASDNPDQRRYPRKVCNEDVFCLGKIVLKQSERI